MNNLINLADRIFVAGSNGMAGKAICKSLRKKGMELKKKEEHFYHLLDKN